jgi:serine/threonine protein kinase
MDPLTVIKTCYELYESIHERVETAVKNRHQFDLLKDRVAEVETPLKHLQKLHVEGKLPCSVDVLRNFLKLLTKIDVFVKEKRFQQQASIPTTTMYWFSEMYYASDDQARFVEFDKLISNHLQNLNLHITVTLFDYARSQAEYARAAHQDIETASQHVRGQQLNVIDSKALSFDPKNKIGEGTFSTVMSGMYNKGYVAVKQVRDMANMSATDVNTILKEARVMQAAEHTNILSLKGVSPSKGLLVMELAVCSLADYLHQATNTAADRARPFVAAAAVPSLQWRIDVIRDVADAVRYLHGYNILHRDIKSPNVLLFRDNTGRTVAKVGDFGLALAVDLITRTAGVAPTTVNPLQQGRAVGTYGYMAPELFGRQRGEKIAYSEASDVYSLGTLANEVLTGRPPWESGAREADIVHWVLVDRERPLLWKEDEADGVPSTELALDRARQLRGLIGGPDELNCCWSQQPSQRCTAGSVYLAVAGGSLKISTSVSFTAVEDDPAVSPAPTNEDDVSPATPPPVQSTQRASTGGTTPMRSLASASSRSRSIGSGLFTWFNGANSVEMGVVGAADDAQSIEDLALDLMRACPCIHSRNANLYAKNLFRASIYNLRRLHDQVKGKTSSGKGAYEKWTAGLGFNRYDAQDIAEWDGELVPSKAQLTLQQLDSAHGEDRLAEWLAMHVPDMAAAAKRQRAAATLCRENITCVERLARRIDYTSVEWWVKLGVDPMDAKSLVEATAAVRVTPTASEGDAVRGMIMDRTCVNPSDELDLVSTLAVELCCLLPDVSFSNAVKYSEDLCAHNIYTVRRLMDQIGGPEWQSLKTGWHDFDAQDAEDLALLPEPPECKPLAEVQAQQGQAVLSLWLLDHVPNIALARLRTQYGWMLVENNVHTLQRLTQRGCDVKWLTAIGVKELDAKDIAAALKSIPLYQELQARCSQVQTVRAERRRVEAGNWYPARYWHGYGTSDEKKRAEHLQWWKPYCENVLSPCALTFLCCGPLRSIYASDCRECVLATVRVCSYAACYAPAVMGLCGRSCAIKAMYPLCPRAFAYGGCCFQQVCCFAEESSK